MEAKKRFIVKFDQDAAKEYDKLDNSVIEVLGQTGKGAASELLHSSDSYESYLSESRLWKGLQTDIDYRFIS